MKRSLPYSQIMRFCGAGAVGVLLYYALLITLTELAKIWYLASAIIAGTCSYTSNFLFHKFWTFGSVENKKIKYMPRQINLYAVMVAVMFLLNVIFLYLLVEYLHLWYIPAQVIASIAIGVISFVASRRIFAD